MENGMKIGIIGLGLIGGSLALAIKEKTDHLVYAANRTFSVLERAANEGAIDGILEDPSEMDLLILTAYPAAAMDWLKENGAKLGKNQTVVDCCGTKQEICALGWQKAREHGFTFVGGHPMAGREFSGYDYAESSLFHGATMILVTETGESPASWLQEFFLSLGFGSIKETDPVSHDRIIAYTSQLAHLLSNAYVQSPTAMKSQGFTGGSFQDLTRVAYLNEEMWTKLFLENKPLLMEELETLIASLNAYHTALQQEDAETLKSLLKKGKEQKIACGIRS